MPAGRARGGQGGYRGQLHTMTDGTALGGRNTDLRIRKFSVCMLLKPGLKDFEHYFASM